MATYTTQLRHIIDMLISDSVKGDFESTPFTILQKCQTAAPKIFDFTYPIILTGKAKSDFETKFLMHFYMREIGGETYALWKLFLQDWLNINMEFWNIKLNALLKAQNLDFFLEYAGSYKDSYKGSIKNTGTVGNVSSGENNDDGMNKYYETPSSYITSISDHLNSANSVENKNEYSNSSTRTDNLQSNDEHTLTHVVDGIPNAADTLLKYTRIAQNVYRDMFNEMEVLFMGIY